MCALVLAKAGFFLNQYYIATSVGVMQLFGHCKTHYSAADYTDSHIVFVPVYTSPT